MNITNYARTLHYYNDKKKILEINLLLAKQNRDISRYNNIVRELHNIYAIIKFRKSQCKNMLKNTLIANENENIYSIEKREFIMIKLMDDNQLLLSLSINDISNLEKKLGDIYLEWNDE